MLTSRQKRFCAAIAVGATQREAAITAGYSLRSAHVRASRLMDDPQVHAEIARLRCGERASYEVRPTDPLQYMLSVMTDPNVDERRRDRMAVAAAKYVHAQDGGGKKRERQEAAQRAVSGRFAPAPPPTRKQ
jgi:phage terminase small subunit